MSYGFWHTLTQTRTTLSITLLSKNPRCGVGNLDRRRLESLAHDLFMDCRLLGGGNVYFYLKEYNLKDTFKKQ